MEQRNMGERISLEEEERLMKIVVENNKKIIKLQKYMGELQIIVQKKKIEEEERSCEKEKEMDRWIEECRKRNEKEREEKEEKRRVEKMRIKEERKAEKEWRCQEIREARREENRRRAMEERKCFGCGGFGHMANHCRNVGKEEPMTVSSNKFKVLKVRVIQRGEQKKSNGRKKVFWVWRFRPYDQSLQKCGKGGTNDSVLK